MKTSEIDAISWGYSTVYAMFLANIYLSSRLLADSKSNPSQWFRIIFVMIS